MTTILESSIDKTESALNELLEACALYRNAIAQKDYAKAEKAISVFTDYTEKHWFKLSVESPIQDEDSLSEIFGEETVYGEYALAGDTQ